MAAVRISRELTGIDGAKVRWDWHPLYHDAVAILNEQEKAKWMELRSLIDGGLNRTQ